jgi:quercetin dioxygenase-like cupin family protein
VTQLPAYPPVRYTGDAGEVSATIRSTDHEPELVYPKGTRVHHLATGAGTDGLFGLYRWEFGPGVGGPDPHFHRTMAESFYILTGEVEIYDGRQWVTTRPGDFAQVPPGGLHGFKNVEGTAATMLLHFAPGAPREAYFEGLARRQAGETMTDAEYDEFMRYHDNIWAD